MNRLIPAFALLLAIVSLPAPAAGTFSVAMKPLTSDGPDQEVVRLVGEKNLEIVQFILRNGKEMDRHSVEEAATIHCVAGSGMLVDDDGRNVPLRPGSIVILPPGKEHVVKATPDISVLVTRLPRPQKPQGQPGMGMGGGRKGAGGGMRPPMQ
ncbi:MAG TPA: cupin domain-containing protein [Thermoanaerobaculia bacterium]